MIKSHCRRNGGTSERLLRFNAKLLQRLPETFRGGGETIRTGAALLKGEETLAETMPR